MSFDLGTEVAKRIAARDSGIVKLREEVNEPATPDCIVMRRVGGYHLYLLTAQARTWVAEYVSDPKFDTGITGTPLVVGTREAYSILDGFMDEGMTLA